MTNKPVVSIIICTCNRAVHLSQTLDALARVCVPTSMQAELIVVDNASTDKTTEVVKQSHLPNMPVHYFHEPRRGQCYARNSGIESSDAEIIVFTDDDVSPTSDWLQNLCRPIQTGGAEAVLGNISIAPHLERPWMDPIHKMMMASTEYVDPMSDFKLIGGNMAFARSVLTKVPHFDVELGPGALGFLDDSLFSVQLRLAGYRLVTAPDATIVHHFDPARLTRASLQSRSVKQGQSEAYVEYHWEHSYSSPTSTNIARQCLRLLYWRLRRKVKCPGTEGMAPWEMKMLQGIAFDRQMLIERRRPRNYERHGLTKRNGTIIG